MLKSGGPGALTLAWIGMVVLLVGAAAVIQFTDWTGGDDDAVTLALSNEPERFARPAPTSGENSGEGFDQDAGSAAMISGDQNASPNASPDALDDLPVVRSARPGELPAPVPEDGPDSASGDDPDPATQAEALASEGANAAVIRLEDLPRPGEERSSAPAGRPLRVAGTAPGSPDPALWRETGNGPYPKIADDGRRPARYYARTFAATSGAPRIGLIISGLGLSPALTNRAIDALPAEATLAFAPYARNLDTISRSAAADGHEFMLELPMEAGGVDAERLGPAGLMTGYSREDNSRRLDWILTRATGYFGVTNYLGTVFSADADAMEPVLSALRSAGLAYVSDAPLADDLSLSGMTSARIETVISGTGTALADDLAALERSARNRGAVLAKVYVTEDNLDTVAGWASSLEQKGIALAPASALAR